MFRLLTDPDEFFARRVDQPGVVVPVTIVGMAAVASLLTPIALFVKLLSGASAAATAFFSVGIAVGMISGLFGTFAMWLFVASVCHGIAWRLNGTGGFRTTLLLCGWGFLPTVIGGVLSAVIVFQFVEAGGGDASLVTMSRQIQSSASIWVGNALGNVFTIWSGMLWIFAVKQTHELSLRQSVLTVVPQLFVLIGLSVHSFI